MSCADLFSGQIIGPQIIPDDLASILFDLSRVESIRHNLRKVKRLGTGRSYINEL